MKKKRRDINRSHSFLFPYTLIALGICLLTLWGTHVYFRTRSLTLNEAILATLEQAPQHAELPVRIHIPSITTVDIVRAGKINGEWTISEHAANFVMQSATPGTPGNSIIYGHNTYNIFANLIRTKRGDRVTVYMSNGAILTYTVVDIQEVAPDRTDLLKPTVTEVLTIYTCSGWLDSKRFVLRAVPTL